MYSGRSGKIMRLRFGSSKCEWRILETENAKVISKNDEGKCAFGRSKSLIFFFTAALNKKKINFSFSFKLVASIRSCKNIPNLCGT